MKSFVRIAWLFASALLGAALPAWAQLAPERPTIVLGVPQNTLDSGISAVVLREAYWRLGYQLRIRNLPAVRSLMMSNNGEVDGELQRIASLGSTYPNLIQVLPAINYLEVTAFSHNRAIAVTDWESARPYRLGIIRGIKFSEINTEGMNREIIIDYPNAFEMLRRDRIDLVLAAGLNGRYFVQLMKFSDIRDIPMDVPRVELFHYLHKRHKALAAALVPVLEEMKSSGEIARIQKHVMTVLLARASQGLPSCDTDFRCFEAGLPNLRKGSSAARTGK